MSILDTIKNSVLEGFDTSVTGTDMVLGLLVALLGGLFILFIYRMTTRQVTLNRSFCITLLLVSAISAMMVLCITSNLALSLGMVGALSIVRFRTAIKDASDTAFLFWSVAVGITSGAGFYMLTLLGCLLVGVICVIAILLFDRISKPFLLVIRTEDDTIERKVAEILKKNGVKFALSSMVSNDSYAELIYELGVSNRKQEIVSTLKAIPGVTTVSLVNCQKG